MAVYRVPFDEVRPDEDTDAFDPAPVLARISDEGLLDEQAKGTVEGTVDTPWGELGAENRGEGVLLVDTPAAEVATDQVLLNVAAMKLGIDKDNVQQSRGSIQEIDVGEPILVVPMGGADEVREAPEKADPSSVPGVDTKGGIVYAVTQESPYVKLIARLWGTARPMTALAAAGMHLVLSEGFRPTYPRTRIVGQLLDHGEEQCEITVQAREVRGGPVVERVLVGGVVRPIDT